VQSAAQSEEGFKQFVEETERMRIYCNPAFGIYSNANEPRETFLERCFEEARRQVNDQSERLESTFRRRIDQVKELSERDQRELDNDDTQPMEQRGQDVNVAWGQTIYNITSGKPAALAEAPHSLREDDYLTKIRQIQRSWEKELEGIRDAMQSKAREIEEIVITPTPKNIEITKYLILWAAGL
jgi:hypothetical protein